jgi:ABC-type antimicrobial peptide transport system permease subunit
VTPGNELAVINALRGRITARYPDLIAPRMLTLDQQLANQLLPQRMTSLIALSTGALELLLAAVGLYGLMLYLLLARTREVGVRMALGARPVQASWAITRDGLRYALRGIAVGLALGIPGALIADKMLIGTNPTDPIPFLAALSVVLLAVVGAAFIPARRAARLQPAVALRHD